MLLGSEAVLEVQSGSRTGGLRLMGRLVVAGGLAGGSWWGCSRLSARLVTRNGWPGGVSVGGLAFVGCSLWA